MLALVDSRLGPGIFICDTRAAGRALLNVLWPIFRLATIAIRASRLIRLPSVILQVNVRLPGVLATQLPSRR